VRLPSLDQRPDPEIAREAVSALKAQLPLSSETIKVIVKAGHVMLEGAVDWQHQRTTAQDTVRRLRGVRDVTNLHPGEPKVTPSDVKQKIEEAFRRNAEIDAGHVLVEAAGSKVVLRGSVRSWAEREEASRAAWAAPGITKVDNRIAVSP
jgi:osmotically-inducible protein OsmY